MYVCKNANMVFIRECLIINSMLSCHLVKKKSFRHFQNPDKKKRLLFQKFSLACYLRRSHKKLKLSTFCKKDNIITLIQKTSPTKVNQYGMLLNHLV